MTLNTKLIFFWVLFTVWTEVVIDFRREVVVLCGKMYKKSLAKKEKRREQLRRSSDWLMGLLSEQQVVLWNELNGSSTVGSFTSVQNMAREMLPWMSIVTRGLKALSSLFSENKLPVVLPSTWWKAIWQSWVSKANVFSLSSWWMFRH